MCGFTLNATCLRSQNFIPGTKEINRSNALSYAVNEGRKRKYLKNDCRD